jgi:hypothetical protein
MASCAAALAQDVDWAGPLRGLAGWLPEWHLETVQSDGASPRKRKLP